jgi:hypothetical protein
VVRSSLNAQQNDCANALLLIDRDVRTELTVDDIEAGCSGSFLGVFHIKDDILESYESP